MKLKTYVITPSKMFPQGHPRAGQPTNFRESFERGLKIHTIRCNYDLWAKRLDEVIAGRAVISVRQWSGKPYDSKQEPPIRILTKEDSVGYQKITQQRLFTDGCLFETCRPLAIEKMIQASIGNCNDFITPKRMKQLHDEGRDWRKEHGR